MFCYMPRTIWWAFRRSFVWHHKSTMDLQTPRPTDILFNIQVEQMLRVNPAIRISASTLLKHPWIKVTGELEERELQKSWRYLPNYSWELYPCRIFFGEERSYTWDGAKALKKSWDIYYINWLAGFLNHQQYHHLGLWAFGPQQMAFGPQQGLGCKSWPLETWDSPSTTRFLTFPNPFLKLKGCFLGWPTSTLHLEIYCVL